MTQPFLETGEQGFLVARLQMDHPVRRQSGLRQSGSEQIRAGDAPQDLAAGPGRDSGGEEGGGGAIHCAMAAAGDFMQRADGQSAAGQTPVDPRKSEGQGRARPLPAPFKALDTFAKCGNGGAFGLEWHVAAGSCQVIRTLSLECSFFVLIAKRVNGAPSLIDGSSWNDVLRSGGDGVRNPSNTIRRVTSWVAGRPRD